MVAEEKDVFLSAKSGMKTSKGEDESTLAFNHYLFYRAVENQRYVKVASAHVQNGGLSRSTWYEGRGITA